MSWSLQTEPVKRNEISEAIAEKMEGAARMQGEADEEFVRHQIDIARGHVADMAHSGFLGDETVYLKVNLSGHANPGHMPRDGYANDMIVINIQQVAAP